MFRKFVAVTLFVSFIAMATSGMMMFVIERPSFTIQMHPVHKLFGLLMVMAATAHLVLNFRQLKKHLQVRSAAVVGVALTIALMLLYGVAINNKVDTELAKKMDEAAAQQEARRK
jgi:cytochrome b561